MPQLDEGLPGMEGGLLHLKQRQVVAGTERCGDGHRPRRMAAPGRGALSGVDPLECQCHLFLRPQLLAHAVVQSALLRLDVLVVLPRQFRHAAPGALAGKALGLEQPLLPLGCRRAPQCVLAVGAHAIRDRDFLTSSNRPAG